MDTSYHINHRFTLQSRHNGRDNVSNHQPHDCLLNRLFRRTRKTSKIRVTGLCLGNTPVTDEFPAQMASNAENISIWWRYHDFREIREWLDRASYKHAVEKWKFELGWEVVTLLRPAWWITKIFLSLLYGHCHHGGSAGHSYRLERMIAPMGRVSIKILPCQYMGYYCIDLYNENPYTWKHSLYWDGLTFMFPWLQTAWWWWRWWWRWWVGGGSRHWLVKPGKQPIITVTS